MSDGARHLSIVPSPGPEDDVQLTLMDHLRELRKRIIYCAWALMLAFFVTYYFSEPIFRWIMAPIHEALTTCDAVTKVCTENGKLIMTTPTMAFFVYMRVAAYAAVALAFPFLLYQFYRFVSPGLYRREKQLIVPFVVIGVVFFAGGALFGRYIILPFALDVLVKGYTGPGTTTGISPYLSIDETCDMVLMVLMAFGIIFEMPLVLTLLARMGVVSSAFLRKYRRHAIVGNTILAAIITPTGDAFNLALMAIPLVIFYELGIIGASFMERHRKEGEGIRMPDEPPAA